LTQSIHPTLKHYKSAPNTHRSFCGNCGSSLAFNDDQCPENTEIYLGTIDEEFMKGDVGTELVGGASHIWMENAVPGVTDGMAGRKYRGNREDGEMK
jgi:hypothetical protein